MAAAYLESLRVLAGHAARLAEYAQRGDWDSLAAEAPAHQAHFERFSRQTQAAMTATERDEARTLLAATLDHHERLKNGALPWLSDAATLLRDIAAPTAR